MVCDQCFSKAGANSSSRWMYWWVVTLLWLWSRDWALQLGGFMRWNVGFRGPGETVCFGWSWGEEGISQDFFALCPLPCWVYQRWGAKKSQVVEIEIWRCRLLQIWWHLHTLEENHSLPNLSCSWSNDFRWLERTSSSFQMPWTRLSMHRPNCCHCESDSRIFDFRASRALCSSCNPSNIS